MRPKILILDATTSKPLPEGLEVVGYPDADGHDYEHVERCKQQLDSAMAGHSHSAVMSACLTTVMHWAEGQSPKHQGYLIKDLRSLADALEKDLCQQ